MMYSPDRQLLKIKTFSSKTHCLHIFPLHFHRVFVRLPTSSWLCVEREKSVDQLGFSGKRLVER